MSTTVSVALADAGADAIETAADCLEAQLRWLDSLARQAGPAAHDDADFVQWHTDLKNSLRALRGGLSV